MNEAASPRLISLHTSITEDFLRWQSEYPDKIAVNFVKNGTQLVDVVTYRQLFEKIAGLANLLHKKGMKGKPVLICVPPGIDYIVGFFACVFSEAIAVPCTVS